MVHINNDLNHVVVTKTNFEYLFEIEMIMGLVCIIPMLKSLHAFIKFAQTCDTFVCDFVTNFKLCCVELYKLFFDMETKYGQEHYWICIIVAMTNYLLHGGLIQQQTFNMWYFIYITSNINYVRNAHTLGCSPKPLEMIWQLLLKLSRCNVCMLLCAWFHNLNINSQVRTWWLPHASYILSINWTFLLKNFFEVT